MISLRKCRPRNSAGWLPRIRFTLPDQRVIGLRHYRLFELAGPSGAFKTTLVALCQQHFGVEMDARAQPAHFSSTGNALEALGSPRRRVFTGGLGHGNGGICRRSRTV